MFLRDIELALVAAAVLAHPELGVEDGVREVANEIKNVADRRAKLDAIARHVGIATRRYGAKQLLIDIGFALRQLASLEPGGGDDET